MTKYTSFMKYYIDEFISYRKASNYWNKSYESYLKTFENYCLNNYDDAKELTQEMVNSWCSKRKTEKNNSYNTRIGVIIIFLKYTNARGITNLNVPSHLKPEKYTYIPHVFTEKELNNFFYACDHIEIKVHNIQSQNNQLTIPVFFRLLYSTGMRTIEARALKVENVDLINGIISIEKSKGYDQHYVVLNDLMKDYLIKYSNEINILYPNRTYFFPTNNDKIHSKKWLENNFRKYWSKYNDSYVVPYDLRHHYAITNINSWIDKGIEFTDKLYYLSKSMGHSSIESTKYYYSLVPRISDIFKKQINNSFDFVVPEVKDNE